MTNNEQRVKHTKLKTPIKLTTRFDFKREYDLIWRHRTSEVVDADGNLLGTLIYRPEIKKERDKARHIVHCVNVHDELVEALEDAIMTYDPNNGDPRVLDRMTKTLSKAKGE